MRYLVFLIVLVYVTLLIAGCRPLTRKRWYKDLVVYIVLLTWSGVLAIGLVLDWQVSAGTTVTLMNKSVEPLRNMMLSMFSWGME